MIFFFCLIIFIFGSAIGSFLGVVIDRLGSKESIWKGRSHCDHCRHRLQPLDLIPIVSFFLLGRKCRYCHTKLSWFYVLIEFLTGFVYVLAFLIIPNSTTQLLFQAHYQLLLLYYLIVISALLVIFFADIRYGIIPFKAVVIAILTTFIWYALFPFLSFSQSDAQILGLHMSVLSIVGSALGAGGFFFLLFIVTKGRGMGFGDVIYAFLMGFILGFPKIFLGLYLAFVTGAIVSLLLVVLKKKKFRGGTIPFGPFLVFGTIVSLLFGSNFLSFIFRYVTF